jgi:hypothetical protein
MSTNIIGDAQAKRLPPELELPKVQPNFKAPEAPTDNAPGTPPLPPRAADQPSVAPPAQFNAAAEFDPFAPVDVSQMRSAAPFVQTAGQTPLQVQEGIVAPLEKAGVAVVEQSEAARIEESAQQQDISILNYNPPDIDGQVAAGGAHINSLIQQLDLQDRERAAEAQDRYKGQSLQDAMQALDREPEEGTLQRVFKKAGDYFGGATFTDPRDGRQYTTPYVAQTQRALGLPETQKDGPPNIVGGLLYGINLIGAAPIAFAKDRLDQLNRTSYELSRSMPWMKGMQDATTAYITKHAPVIAAQALKRRDESLRNTANTPQRNPLLGALVGDLGRGPGTHMTTVLRGGNYSLTSEMSTGSIGKIPGTKIDVDPGSLVGFAADVATGELVERGVSALVKQGVPAVARLGTRAVTINTLSSRAARRARPAARAVATDVRATTTVTGGARTVIEPPPVKAATIPDYRAVVVRPSTRGTGKAVVGVPSNPAKPVVVQVLEAVPEPVLPTRVYRDAPTPAYNHPKPTGPNGQYELPVGVSSVPTVPSLLGDAPVKPMLVEGEQLVLPGVLPKREQFGMLGVEFHPDNSVVFKGLDDVFEDGDVIAARNFFGNLAEQGQTPTVKFTSDLDETAWDNGFINAIHMGFKPVSNDGTLFNPNLVEFGSDVIMQLTKPGTARKADARSGAEVLGLRTVSDVAKSTDSLIEAVPSLNFASLQTQLNLVMQPSLRYAGDPVAASRLLRDAGSNVGESATKQFGRLTSNVVYVGDDAFDVSFKVDNSLTRSTNASALPVQDIADYSKFIMDLHKRNPSATLEASIAASSTAEWAMKLKTYQRAGFEVVDELGEVITGRIAPGVPVRMVFNPDAVSAPVLVRRLADTASLISAPAVDERFVQLADAAQRRQTVQAFERVLRDEADKAMKASMEATVQPRGLVNELPRTGTTVVRDFTAHTTKLDMPTVYHGTRVQTPDIAQVQHIDGGSPSAIGIGLHVTESSGHARLHAVKSVNTDINAELAREYGAPVVSRYAVEASAAVLDVDKATTELSSIVDEILTALPVSNTPTVPAQLSVKDAIKLVDDAYNDPAVSTLFQRELSSSLRASGVDVLDAGPNARVVLNADVLIDDGLNVPVRGVVDSADSALSSRKGALEIDNDALATDRSISDMLHAQADKAVQDHYEVANALQRLDDEVHKAVSASTLWDYNGVPDTASLTPYKPDVELTPRNAATPFDTQTLDISPCTL